MASDIVFPLLFQHPVQVSCGVDLPGRLGKGHHKVFLPAGQRIVRSAEGRKRSLLIEHEFHGGKLHILLFFIDIQISSNDNIPIARTGAGFIDKSLHPARHGLEAVGIFCGNDLGTFRKLHFPDGLIAKDRLQIEIGQFREDDAVRQLKTVFGDQ